ncbi:DUF7882 family protein [Agromyces albus]|jgi:hypothetical protein|uniref:DUF7882 family protein n=1 Tax=Agromyces albus TaxID=205332 RepID=UPI0027803F96|nr:hypothetical protein [Agromyces albus]MDQ0576137.1 hypothetical protein [Agromyces albus]
MGTLYLGKLRQEVEIEDYALAHVHAVIVAKFRVHEKFILSWEHLQAEHGQDSFWLHPAMELWATFDTHERPHLDRDWLEELMCEANTNGGIIVTDEMLARHRLLVLEPSSQVDPSLQLTPTS